jgi:hypothetical protein
MQFLSKLFLLGAASASISLLSAAQYTQCPSVGSNTGCAVLITINSSGTPTVAVDAAQGPYDGADDTLVGVLNNSSTTIGSLPLSSSTTDIFGFEDDGMCSSGYGAAGNCSKGLTQGDPYDYAGDFVTFTITDTSHGTVNFIGGLAPGASTYFSLEESLSATDITPGTPTPGSGPSSVPEPATYWMMGAGLFACAWLVKRRRQSVSQ